MVEVIVREGEKLEDALKRFKKEVEKEGILKLAREKMYYKSPSVIKKERMSLLKRKLELRKRRMEMKKAK
ncbi:MAG: 30S ribosomal protein S21 [Endomicrobiia bacterium]